MDPFFILDPPKTFEQASAALQEAAVGEGFGVLAVHDLGHTLRSKGLPFPEQCRIFEVCNPQQAAVLSTTMALNMALPCLDLRLQRSLHDPHRHDPTSRDARQPVQRSLLTRAGPSGLGLHHGDHRGRCCLAGELCKDDPDTIPTLVQPSPPD